jgi:hypothetical protein
MPRKYRDIAKQLNTSNMCYEQTNRDTKASFTLLEAVARKFLCHLVNKYSLCAPG